MQQSDLEQYDFLSQIDNPGNYYNWKQFWKLVFKAKKVSALRRGMDTLTSCHIGASMSESELVNLRAYDFTAPEEAEEVVEVWKQFWQHALNLSGDVECQLSDFRPRIQISRGTGRTGRPRRIGSTRRTGAGLRKAHLPGYFMFKSQLALNDSVTLRMSYQRNPDYTFVLWAYVIDKNNEWLSDVVKIDDLMSFVTDIVHLPNYLARTFMNQPSSCTRHNSHNLDNVPDETHFPKVELVQGSSRTRPSIWEAAEYPTYKKRLDGLFVKGRPCYPNKFPFDLWPYLRSHR